MTRILSDSLYQQVVEALSTGKESAETWLAARKQALAGWPEKYAAEERDVAQINAALTSLQSLPVAGGEPTDERQFTVEPHGGHGHYAIYRGRDMHHHGWNLGHLSETTPEVVAMIERALNAALSVGEPKAAPFTRENPCRCGAYGGPESHARWCEFAGEPKETHPGLGEAVERAARDLPSGYEVDLSVEQGAGWVVLRDPRGKLTAIDGADRTLTEQVHAAIDSALGEKGEKL
jgi:hypothetical protein